jgi:hypothetical protein
MGALHICYNPNNAFVTAICLDGKDLYGVGAATRPANLKHPGRDEGLVSAVAWRTLLYGRKAPFDEVAVEVALHPAPNHITSRAA